MELEFERTKPSLSVHLRIISDQMPPHRNNKS
jgi:hypothetical protein